MYSHWAVVCNPQDGLLANQISRVNGVLQLLLDERWHPIADLSIALQLPEPKLVTIVRFLSQHGFVRYRESDGCVRIEYGFKAIIKGYDNSAAPS